jgi:hypothetical protein
MSRMSRALPLFLGCIQVCLLPALSICLCTCNCCSSSLPLSDVLLPPSDVSPPPLLLSPTTFSTLPDHLIPLTATFFSLPLCALNSHKVFPWCWSCYALSSLQILGRTILLWYSRQHLGNDMGVKAVVTHIGTLICSCIIPQVSLF